jgi:hypothetical protein
MKVKKMVRLPNECYFEELDINMDEFKPNTEFEDEVFGWYGDMYISIKKPETLFIIDKIDDPYLLHTILPVVSIDGKNLTLEYKSFDGSTKQVVVNKNDGEYYTEETRLRRQKELMIRNVKDLMDKHNITIEDLKL